MIKQSLFCISIILIISIIYEYTFADYTFIRSKTDKRCYKVRNNGLQHQNADTLASVNDRIIKLITYITSAEPNSFVTCRLRGYNPNILQENINNFDTTFTVNKGSSMHICISNRTGKKQIYDINTLMYVAIHELAHIVTTQIGHGVEFKANNVLLLKHAMSSGIYNYVDYRLYPIEYCGLNLNVNILDQI